MEKKDFYIMTDEELLVEKKKLKKSKLFHATAIGFLIGILIFGVAAWSLRQPSVHFKRRCLKSIN